MPGQPPAVTEAPFSLPQEVRREARRGAGRRQPLIGGGGTGPGSDRALRGRAGGAPWRRK